MLVGGIGVLIAAALLTEVPAAVEAVLFPTNETVGVFTQIKTERGKSYVTEGEYRLRPGVDFEWKTQKPFPTRFYSTLEEYTYENEDERVSRRLSDLPGAEMLELMKSRDWRAILKAFEVFYAADDGEGFHLQAKPRVERLAAAVERVDIDGGSAKWTLRIVLKNGTIFQIEFRNQGGAL